MAIEEGDVLRVAVPWSVYDGLTGRVMDVEQRGGRVLCVRLEIQNPQEDLKGMTRPQFSLAEVERV